MKLTTVCIAGGLLSFASGLPAQIATVPAAPSPPLTGAWRRGGDFVDEATQASKAQAEIGRLALKKSQSADVRNLAAVMVKDSDATVTELADVARRRKLVVTTSAGHGQAKDLQQLESKSGSDFDADYARRAADEGDHLVSLFTAESKAPDPDLAAFAQRKLPQLQNHIELARRLSASGLNETH